MQYDVILEPRTGEPILIGSTPSERRAYTLAEEVMLAHGAASGVKVHVRTADTGDQLQVSQRGEALRDQPHLTATGEALTIHVPTAKVRLGLEP